MSGRTLWTIDEAIQASGGRASGAWHDVTGVSIDSRSLQRGDLFIALQGPNFDGHAYVGDALERGAAAAVVQRRDEHLPENAPLLLVDDTLGALWRLGAAARSRSGASFIAVTGSVGKTGTKEALRSCLSAQAPTSANLGSLNNHWGVPLSLARMPVDVRYGVFELGMNNPGEIRELARIVRPDVAVITNVEATHIGNFDSISAIADAKAEIFEATGSDGCAVLDRDHPLFHHLRDKAEQAGVKRLIAFGRHPDADLRLVDAKIGPRDSEVTAAFDGKQFDYRVSLPGTHWVTNSLAVLAATAAIGADLEAAAGELARLEPIKGRGATHCIELDGGDFTLIDDSYNASPASMRAALEVLRGAEVEGRRIVVLGDMLELGERARELHVRLADLLPACADLALTCGPNMQHLNAVLAKPLRGRHAADSAALAKIVASEVRPGDTVLVKGSLGSRMRVVIDALLALHCAPRAANGE